MVWTTFSLSSWWTSAHERMLYVLLPSTAASSSAFKTRSNQPYQIWLWFRIYMGTIPMKFLFSFTDLSLRLSQATSSTCPMTMWRPVKRCLGSWGTTKWCLLRWFRLTGAGPGLCAALPSSQSSWTEVMVSTDALQLGSRTRGREYCEWNHGAG